jgi:hypothetical protein
MQDMTKKTRDELVAIIDRDIDGPAAVAANAEYDKRKLKQDLKIAAQSIVVDIEHGDIVMAAWSVRRIDNMLNDEAFLAAYGYKLDSSDMMRPRLVKIEVAS